MRENSGIWAGVVFLTLWVIGVGAALTGTLDDLVVWIFHVAASREDLM